MTEKESFNAFELDRLELFTLQILVQSLIHHTVGKSPDRKRLAQAIESTFDATVARFPIHGVSDLRANAARQIMSNAGMDLLAVALQPQSGSDSNHET